MSKLLVEANGAPTWAEGYRPRSLTVAESRALHWAMRATSAACTRSEKGRGDGFTAWTAAVEATWWLHAADDLLYEVIGPEEYVEARQTDECGKVMQGMRWLRNLHLHELRVTGAGGPEKNFFGEPGDGHMLYISPSNRWLPADRIKARERDSDAKARKLYDDTIAGWPLLDVPKRASQWVTRVAQASGWSPPVEPNDRTVL